MADKIDLSKIDLVRTHCPLGTRIEIEGLGGLAVAIPCINGLLSGIATTYAILNGRPVLENEEFLKRITLIDLDVGERRIKVRIAAI